MASFPDLRPNRRSAKAESTAASGNRARLLLAVSTALLLTASLAVSELATLRGARAHDTSVFLTRELGPPLDSSPSSGRRRIRRPHSSSPPSAASSRSARAASRSRRASRACRFASAAPAAPGRLTCTACSGSCRSAARRSCSARTASSSRSRSRSGRARERGAGDSTPETFLHASHPTAPCGSRMRRATRDSESSPSSSSTRIARPSRRAGCAGRSSDTGTTAGCSCG